MAVKHQHSYPSCACYVTFLIFAIYKHLEQGSKLQTALRRHIFFTFALISNSLRLALVFFRLCPSSNTTACFRSCFPLPLSQLTGWHTYQRTKSPSEATYACASELKRIWHANTNTRTGMPTHQYTHAASPRTVSTRFQSRPPSCLRTVHLINSCVRLTKQKRVLSSLNTQAGYIRLLSVPVDPTIWLRLLIKGFIFNTIHPSFHFLPLIHLRSGSGCGVRGLKPIPAAIWWKAAYNLDRSPAHCRASTATHTRTNVIKGRSQSKASADIRWCHLCSTKKKKC